jgi:outer membrane protein
MYTDNFGAELTLGLPPTMTQDLTTPATGPHPAAAKIQLRSPAVLAKYFFGGAQDQWRPYLGLGVAHVSFHKIRTNANDSTIQNLSGNGASLSSTWTPVYNAGLVYKIDEKWSISGSVSYLPVKTTATFVGKPGYGTTTGDVKLNTTDYVVRVGYNF